MTDPAGIAGALARVREAIALAARRAGRDPASVTLLPVTKTVPAQVVREAMAFGLARFGENRVQEAAAKAAGLPGATWDLVGRLQTNKARDAAGLFGLIHSLDRPELAEALDRAGARAGRPVRALVQVSVTGAASQGGVAPADLPGFIEMCRALPYLRIHGLMALGPHPAGEADLRRAFRTVRELYDRSRELGGADFDTLSLGMSGDYPLAVEEGSTLVRIGTAIFGERRQRQ